MLGLEDLHNSKVIRGTTLWITLRGLSLSYRSRLEIELQDSNCSSQFPYRNVQTVWNGFLLVTIFSQRFQYSNVNFSRLDPSTFSVFLSGWKSLFPIIYWRRPSTAFMTYTMPMSASRIFRTFGKIPMTIYSFRVVIFTLLHPYGLLFHSYRCTLHGSWKKAFAT